MSKNLATLELEKGRGVGRKSRRQAEQKIEQLGDTLAKVKVRYWWTPTVKNKRDTVAYRGNTMANV